MKRLGSGTILLSALLFASTICLGQYAVNFTINKLPASHRKENIFIACNCNNWNPGNENAKFIMDSFGMYHFERSMPAGKYEYKFTRGDWSKSESGPDGKGVPNRILDLQRDTTIVVSIEGWSDDFPSNNIPKKHTASRQVSIMDTAFYIPQLNTKRRIWIYLPADYRSTRKKYPVLYMHDGQNLFDDVTSGYGEWGVDECLDSLFLKGNRECIIIGIDNGPNRINEYNPFDNARSGVGEGDKYVDFLTLSLKPFVDSHYRTLKDKANTFIAGSSMGGLISFYAAVKYPGIYGGAGIFSPSFWIAPAIDSALKKSAAQMNGRLFFYAGGKEGDEMITDMKRIEGEVKNWSRSKTKEEIDPSARHNEAAWRKYFPEFYLWLTQKK